MQETEKQLQNRQIQGAIKLTRGEKKKKKNTDIFGLKLMKSTSLLS